VGRGDDALQIARGGAYISDVGQIACGARGANGHDDDDSTAGVRIVLAGPRASGCARGVCRTS
jgi:hypothetical protein